MRILVVGATGFIGRHLVRSLHQDGHTVFSLIRNKKKFDQLALPGKALFFNSSMTQFLGTAENEGIEVVVHCAGMLFSFKEKDYYDINSEWTKELIHLLSTHYSHRRIKFIFLSSVSAHGPSASFAMSDDRPLSHYGKSKLLAEKFLRHSLPSAWTLCIVRPPIVIGPEDSAFNEIYQLVKMRFTPYPGLGGLKKIYSFIGVFDLVDYIKKMIYTQKELLVGPYYPANPCPITYRELINEIKRTLGIGLTVSLPIPYVMLEFICYFYAAYYYLSGGKVLSSLTKDKLQEMMASEWIFSSPELDKSLDFMQSNYVENLEVIFKKTLAI